MKLYKSYLLIAVSFIALAILMLIQVNWIIQAAKAKEELFNEKANMVLSRTAEALCSDKEACMNMDKVCTMEHGKECRLELEEMEIKKIDALLQKFMKRYNFHLNYSFEVIKPGDNLSLQNEGILKQNVFKRKLDAVANKSGLEIKLIFPDKRQLILNELGTPFITSIVLIIVVLVLFWRTILLQIREKKIAEHTRDFINNMTHEFKTPLTNIALAGKMILKEAAVQENDKVKQYMSIILDEKEKLRLQVEQVLNMSEFERGEIPLNKTELDFHQLIHDSVKCMSVQVENKQGELKQNLLAENFVILGDKNHLINALCNLFDNAIKYAKGSPHISIDTLSKDGQLLVKISDKGIGIDKAYLSKIFDKFYRVPTGDVHDVKGFGLGLAYVKKIIELHQGKIEAHSEKDQGTVFIISIPYLV